jgi:hypothetical protein
LVLLERPYPLLRFLLLQNLPRFLLTFTSPERLCRPSTAQWIPLAKKYLYRSCFVDVRYSCHCLSTFYRVIALNVARGARSVHRSWRTS